jgi:hypothetical protein
MKELLAKELHRPVRRNFPTRRVELKGVDDLYQADLVEMIPYSKVNNGYKYIMTVINCFTKFAHAVPLKTKSAQDVAIALEPILKQNKMKHFQTDQGTEWFNSKVGLLMKKYNINHYNSYSEKKASIVERFNRTLKEKMWTMFTAQGSYKWLTLLPKLVVKYNNTKHRTIGMKPKDVNRKNATLVMQNINKATFRQKNIRAPKFKINDSVRISRYKTTFRKGYLPNWTNEIFTIHTINPSRPPTYLLKDIKGEVVKGSFYEHELMKTKHATVYLVEKVLRRKGDKVYVKWAGFDSTHNSWIDKKDIL